MKDRFPQFNFYNISKTRVSPQKPLYGNNELHMAIPYGKKYYAWFTFHKTYDVCVFMNPATGNFYYEKVAFSPLSLGTILYGTIVEEGGNRGGGGGAPRTKRFVAENLFYFEGRNLEGFSFFQKMEIFNKLFYGGASLPRETPIYLAPIWRGVEIPSFVNLTKTYTIYVIAPTPTPAPEPTPMPTPEPIVSGSTKKESIDSSKQTSISVTPAVPVSAPATTQKNKNGTKNGTKANLPPPPPPEKNTFYVKADIINDIYHLFTAATCKPEQYHSIAFIPDYKTSVFMNSIFRKIKENINLDYLEESDDDEDFEDTRYDKYVNLEKVVKMSCAYNNKFKKWVPKSIISKFCDSERSKQRV